MRGVSFCAMAIVVVAVAPMSAYGGMILFVGASGSPSAEDNVMIAHLESLPFVGSGNVAYVEGAASSASSADGKDLVIVTAAVSSSTVGGKFTDVASGVLTWESFIMDDMAMATNVGGGPIRKDAVFAGGPITTLAGITPSATPIALFSTVVSGQTMSGQTFGLPSSAVLEATAPISSDVDEFFALFSIEAGALAGHATAGRRVGMFGPNATFTPAQLTADGLNVFNAAVEWAIPEPATMALLAFGGLAMMRRRK